jgi:hypothetical protein
MLRPCSHSFTGLRHTLRVCSNFCFFFVLKSHLSMSTFAPFSLLFFFAFLVSCLQWHMTPPRVSALSTTATTTGPVKDRICLVVGLGPVEPDE